MKDFFEDPNNLLEKQNADLVWLFLDDAINFCFIRCCTSVMKDLGKSDLLCFHLELLLLRYSTIYC